MTTLTRRAAPAPLPDMEHDKVMQMRLPGEVLAALDDLRRRESDLPTRSEMIRRLIARATQASRKGK